VFDHQILKYLMVKQKSLFFVLFFLMDGRSAAGAGRGGASKKKKPGKLAAVRPLNLADEEAK